MKYKFIGVYLRTLRKAATRLYPLALAVNFLLRYFTNMGTAIIPILKIMRQLGRGTAMFPTNNFICINIIEISIILYFL